MGRFRFLTFALLLIQVLTTRASQSQYVFGPQEFLDSGQADDRDRPNEKTQEDSSLEIEDATPRIGEEDYFHVVEDSGDDQYDYYNEYENEEEWSNYDGGAEGAEGADGWNEVERESSHLPLKRIRRRIIPVGKAIDRDRGAGDRSGTGRTRSEWAQAPKTTDVSRRTGPTGSAALFSLYPELAPPDMRESYQNKKKSKVNQRDIEGKKTKKEARDTKTREEKTKKRGDESKKGSKNQKKKRVRLTKDEKEEIAVYANEHGVDKATSHFRTKLDAPLKTVAVEKFLRRYKNRQMRRGDRKGHKG